MIVADALRVQNAAGNRNVFSHRHDEHGINIERAAQKNNRTRKNKPITSSTILRR